jgi:hypothetical protein
MRLAIKNSIQLCLRTLVFSIVLRHSNYNNRIISIEGTFFWDTLYNIQLVPRFQSLTMRGNTEMHVFLGCTNLAMFGYMDPIHNFT